MILQIIYITLAFVIGMLWREILVQGWKGLLGTLERRFLINILKRSDYYTDDILDKRSITSLRDEVYNDYDALVKMRQEKIKDGKKDFPVIAKCNNCGKNYIDKSQGCPYCNEV